MANEIRIVLIGKTGSGKSASGNTFLGVEYFKSETSGVSLTQKCSSKTENRFGKKLMVVDTPGLFDTGMSNEEVTKEIVKCIALSAPGPHAFVLVVTPSRFTKEEQDTVHYLSEIFGQEMYNYMIVLFTRRDEIERQNINIHEFIKTRTHPMLQDVLQKCRGQTLAINNVQERHMREKDAETFNQLVNEVTRKNGGRYYSNEMYEEAEKQLVKRIQEVQRRKEEEKENEKRQIKKEIEFEYQDKIENIERQRQITERKELESRAKVRELEEERCIRERQNANERMLFEQEREIMSMERAATKRMVQEAEERAIALKRRMEQEKDDEIRQSKKEMETILHQKLEAEAKERKKQEEEKELQHKRDIAEVQSKMEQLKIDQQRELLYKQNVKLNKRFREVEENEAAMRRERAQKEETALKELELKYQKRERQLREEVREEVKNEDEGIFSSLRNVGKSVWNTLKRGATWVFDTVTYPFRRN